jgi:hypothetical protein
MITTSFTPNTMDPSIPLISMMGRRHPEIPGAQTPPEPDAGRISGAVVSSRASPYLPSPALRLIPFAGRASICSSIPSSAPAIASHPLAGRAGEQGGIHRRHCLCSAAPWRPPAERLSRAPGWTPSSPPPSSPALLGCLHLRAASPMAHSRPSRCGGLSPCPRASRSRLWLWRRPRPPGRPRKVWRWDWG